MTITAKVIADSLSPKGTRLTTFELRYPRFIHAELLTHRMFSRNSSSSRAIPVARMIQDVIDDPAMPIHWGKNQPGMQAREEHTRLVGSYEFPEGDVPVFVEVPPQEAWLKARDWAVAAAKGFSEAGYHKQIVNRLLEPFAPISVVVTATEWANWFQLRLHEDAQPEIRELALQMLRALTFSEPRQLEYGQWHLPYIVPEDLFVQGDDLLKLSAARCARVSYLTHDKRRPDLSEDLNLFERLAGAHPRHLSPLEHQATPSVMDFANLKGWRSFRSTLEVD